MIESPLLQSTRDWLAQEAPALPSDLQAAIEALYLAVEAGHVCIRCGADDADAWRATGWVGRPGDYRPFVLEDSGRFYLARYWWHEDRVASMLRERARMDVTPSDPQRLRHDLDALFPDDADDRQRQAALVAQFKPLTLVSGGPGTGKTTTVVKMLALLQAQHGAKPLRILLAAPTGKAAQRLMESIRDAKQKLPLAPEVAVLIPEEAQTLHRLLGALGDTGRFRHGEDNPLACDLLLVDEASMIDLAMMHAVLAALPREARLILLGDRDQLASVEAGSVFGDLCAAEGCTDALRQLLQPFKVNLVQAPAASVLADSRIELVRSYRFSRDSGIAMLARAARVGAGAEFAQTLASAAGDIAWLPAADTDSLRRTVQDSYAEFRAAAAAGDPATAFAAFLGFRVLCAHRQGRAGVDGLNALLEDGRAGSWYAGRPVIVRENDYALRLFNGDIGICLATPQGLRVFFETGNGQFRALSPGRLPACESAWAMTVHQSQGSEFDRVLLVLPEAVTPVLDRPLVYTAVTRARSHFTLCGSEGVLQAALATLPRRESGLVEKLRLP